MEDEQYARAKVIKEQLEELNNAASFAQKVEAQVRRDEINKFDLEQVFLAYYNIISEFIVVKKEEFKNI